MSKGGAPSKYQGHYPVQVKWMARHGLTEEEMAKELGIARSTFSLWKLKHPELSDALKGGKALALARVEDALYQRALGFEVTETETIIDPVTRKATRSKVTTKHVLPDTTACIFILKNMDKKNWRDTHEVENTGTVTVRQEVEDALVDALAAGGEISRRVDAGLREWVVPASPGGHGRKN